MADLALDIYLRARDDFSHVFKTLGVEAEGLRGKIGLLAGGFGLLAGGVLAKSVKDAADWQSKTQELANNTNMGAAGLKAMREESARLAAQTGQDRERIAEGYMHIANHAYSAAAASNILTAATKNAAATGGDAADDANILAGVMREYGVSQKDAAQHTELATRYMDVLHNAVANSNFTMKDFTEGSKRAIATAAGFGVPLSQVSAQLAVLSLHGFPSARVASQNWAGMLRSLEAPTSAARKQIEYLSHVTGVDLVGDIKKVQKDGAYLPQFLQDIMKATHGDFNLMRRIMPQSSYATALLALIRNYKEFDDVQKKTDAAEHGKKLKGMVGTNEAFAAQQKTLNGLMGDFKQTLHGVFITIGEALLPVLTKLVRAAMPIIQHIATWISHHQMLTVKILAGVAAVGTLIGALLLLAPVFGFLFSQAGMIAVGIGVAIGAMVLFATHTQEIKDILLGIWSGIADNAASLWLWLTGIWNGISGDAMLLWENLGDWLGGLWNGITSTATSIWNGVAGFFKTVWDGVSGAWHTVWDPIGGWLHKTWTDVTTDAGNVWTGAINTLKGIWGGISGAWTTAWNTIKNTVHNKWTEITNTVHNKWNGAKNAIEHLWGGVTGAWTRAWNGIKNFFSGLKLDTKAGNILATAKTDVQNIWAGVTGAWGNAWNTIKNALVNKWTDIKNTAHTWGGNIVHGLADGIGAAISALTSLGGAVGTVGTSIFDTLGTMATNVGTWFDQNLIQPAKQWGKNLIHAFADGIRAVWHKVLAAFHDLQQAIKDFHPSSPAKRGPFQKLPTYTWIADQMRAALPSVHAASADIMAAMPSGSHALDLTAQAHALGLSPGAGSGLTVAGAASGAGSVVNLNNAIHINGGTFTDRKSIQDLAQRVSEEIMHSVRMQGGLLPQM